MLSHLPNSPAQQARLRAIAEQGAVGTLGRCVTAALDITGTTTVEDLEAGVAYVLGRRPALRSAFRGDRDTHRIAASVRPLVRRVEVAGGSPVERWSATHRLSRQDAHRPFPLGEPPLLRATLFDTGGRQLFLLAMDQLACDAWSANLIVDELVWAADRAARGLPLPAAEPDRYEAVRRARAAWVGEPAGRAAVARRRAALDGHRLRWPLGDGRPATRTTEVIEEAADLPIAATTEFLDRVRTLGGSVFSAAALAFALAQGEADRVALTSMFACRKDRVEESVVGWFSNQVAVPLPPLAGTVAEHLRAVRGSLAQALNDQAAPYPLVVTRARPEDEPGGLSVSLLYLPVQLSGDEQTAMRIGAAGVERCGVSICPTGADVDLYVLEGLTRVDDRTRVSIRIGAISDRAGLDRTWLAGLVRRWEETIVRLGRLDWRTARLGDLPVGSA